jgi:hypothetical protein
LNIIEETINPLRESIKDESQGNYSRKKNEITFNRASNEDEL